MNVDNLRLSKDMKYEALYWALGFEEFEKNVFTKLVQGVKIKIFADEQKVDFNKKISIINGKELLLNTHKSFVILECVDKLLTMGYSMTEIIIDLNNEYDIFCGNLYIKCYEWGKMEEDNIEFTKDVFKSISYSSRLISGVIERKTSIKTFDGKVFEHGIFENERKLSNYKLYNSKDIVADDFIITDGVAVKYTGNDKKVVVPEGVTDLSPCLFWDNQTIEEVCLPTSLVNLSGDTFYNSSNLKKVVIPKNVKYMGNNPFAGCPEIQIENKSPYFNLVDGVLYNKDFTRLIYYPISKTNDKYEIKNGCKILGKHSFYLNLKLNNLSDYYHIEDDVIYDRDYYSVIGCLNSIDTDCLTLKNVKRICRNSFWNCKGIRKIVLPASLEGIGYNPFVSCSNIEFVSNSTHYVVYNNALYTKDMSKLVCYPSKYAVGEVHLPDETITLERGAFSGAEKMTEINLHNVSIISKTCFTNCNSLTKVYCSDLVTYIGEWAFAHCENLKELSVYKYCFIDNNATLNSDVKLEKRQQLSNYVIESDNIYTLKSMQKMYRGKIKSILIDPPYNSHIDYINYKDDFNNGYEKFMSDRIKLSYDLLSEDGFLVINIDKGEVKNLTNLCKELFYKVKVCKWEKLHPYFDTNRDVKPDKKVVKYEYIIVCYKSQKSKLNMINQPYIEKGQLKEKQSKFPGIFSCFGTNSSAKDEIKEIFGDRKYFSTPKPAKLIKELVRATTDKNSIVLDYFAGSGTTGQAVIELNMEDNGNRKYILISNNENDICKNVTLKRIKLFDDKVTFID